MLNQLTSFVVYRCDMKQYYLLALLLLLLGSCASPGQHDKTPDGKLNILATTGMIADVTRNIVGDKAEVTALMGPGVDPHLYKATQSDLSKLNQADVVLYNGFHLEGKMVEILKKLGAKKPVLPVAEIIPAGKLRMAEAGEAIDPHLWFDVEIWTAVTAHISQQIRKIDSTNANYYAERTKNYLQELTALDAWVHERINLIPEDQRLMITAHDAFEYFGEAYGVEVRGLQGISTVAEFGLQDVTNLVDLLVERNIKAVFVESSVSDRSVNAVVEGARERGHEVVIGGTLYSDAMGEDGTPDGTYIGMVKHNVNTIVEALK